MFSRKIKSMKECKNLKDSEMAIENNSFPITNWKGDKRPFQTFHRTGGGPEDFGFGC